MNRKEAPPMQDMRPLNPTEFKRNPRMMAQFNSYEEYREKIAEPFLKLQEYGRVLEEEINLEKIEPIEPWETPIKRAGGP